MRYAAVVLLLLSSVCSFGESKSCLTPTLVVPDGRIVNSPQFEGSFNGYNPVYWYAFSGQAMHSYSLEFVPTIDNENNSTSIGFANLTAWGPNDIAGLQSNGCFGQSTLSFTANQAFTPSIARGKYGAGQRISFIQPTSGIVIFSITNTASPGAYSYRVIDTTLFNPRWSTWSGYDTSWGFNNLSDMTITGTLSVYETSGRLLWNGSIVVSPGGQLFHTSGTSDLSLPRNDAGYAVFSHNGPPQGILADAYMVNSNATVVVYAKFESRSQQ